MSEERIRPQDELIITLNESVPGLKPGVLEDLRSIALHYGSYFPDNPEILNFTSSALDSTIRLIISTPIHPKGLLMIVAKSEQPDSYLVNTSKGGILWDQTLTSEEAEESIRQMNIRATELGIYDPQTNQRAMIISEARKSKYSVEQVFSNPSTAYLVINQDPIEALNQFDNPELLMIKEMPGGGFTIVLRSEVFEMKRREQIVRELLIERGIDADDLEQVGSLGWTEILALREEVKRRMQT